MTNDGLNGLNELSDVENPYLQVYYFCEPHRKTMFILSSGNGSNFSTIKCYRISGKLENKAFGTGLSHCAENPMKADLVFALQSAVGTGDARGLM